MRTTPYSSLLLILSCAIPAAEVTPRTILLGSDLSPDRSAAVRELFYESGLNCARITGGGYSWAAGSHEGLAKDLAAHDVHVYLQLGSHYPSGDYFALKDAWLVDQRGATGVEDRSSWAIRYDSACWPQYSYAHQGMREKFTADFTSYLTHFPASKQLDGVILHNEPGMHWLKDRLFDYSAVSIAAFKAWLPSQHKDIAELNRRWGTTYASFADVVPPTAPALAAMGGWLDWRRFQVVQIADFMRWEAEFVKRVRPDLNRTTNLDGPTNNWYAVRCSDIEAYSRAMDTVGIDIYPSSWTDRDYVPYAIDQLQGVAQGRRTDVLECEVFGDRSGAWIQLSPDQRADLLRSELWTMYGHGADGLLLWGFSRGDDFSITDDGAWNPRVLVCRDVTHQTRMIGLGKFHRAPSTVVLCLDPDTYIRSAGLESDLILGGSALDQEFHGIHAALSAAGIQCDVIMNAQLPAVASHYRALILPASPMMDIATAQRLRTYVNQGGTVIATAPFAALDRWGAPLPTTPGCGLDQLIGGTSSEMTAAENGIPAISTWTRGTGHTALIPTPTGAAYLGGSATGLPKAIAGLLARAHVSSSVQVTCTGNILPDTTVLSDGTNRLLVVAVQSNKGNAASTADNVQIKIVGAVPKAAFAFPATAITDGVVRSGPIAVPMVAIAGGCAVKLGTVSSALPVLLAVNAGPLLSLAAPAQVTAGAKVALQVTCHNPSNVELRGSIALRQADLHASSPVVIPARASASVTLEFIAPAATARLPLSAVLTSAMGDVVAIPIDIEVR